MKNNSLLISFFVVYDFWSQCTFAQFVIIQRLNNTTRRGSKHTSIFFTRPSPSSSAETPEERLGSSRSGTSHLRDFLSIEFRPADIPVWPMWPSVKNCFGLHGHSAFDYVVKRQIGVGQQYLLPQVQLTDPVHLLQTGKTVDISRCASEINRLAFRFPHCLGRIRGLRPRPPSPEAGRLPAAAGHRAAVVDVVAVVSGGGVLQWLSLCECHGIVAIGRGVPLIPYQKTSCQVPYLSIGITAIGDNESFDKSRLRRNFALVVCGGRCKAFVVRQSLRPKASARCEYGNVVSCGR